MLDVKRLRVLREVVAQGSFSAAAEALAYTQSAVSQQIAALEREAGTRLVERSSRGVTPTEAGRALVAHADAVLARLADAELELDAIAGLRAGRVRIAAFQSVAGSIMPIAIARYRERYPGVELQLIPAEPPEGLQLLRSGEVDVVMVIDGLPSLEDPPGFELRHVLDEPMHVVVPADHPVALSGGPVRLADLADEQWMMSTSGDCPDTSLFWSACRKAGFEPRVPFELDDYNAIQGFVASGMGVAVVPEIALKAIRDDVAVRPIVPKPLIRGISAATLHDSFCSPARQAMLDVLAEVGEEFAARQGEALAAA